MLKLIVLLLFLAVIPYIFGCGLLPDETDPYRLLSRYCLGWIVLYGIFYLPALICNLKHTSLTFLTNIYLLLLAAAILLSLGRIIFRRGSDEERTAPDENPDGRTIGGRASGGSGHAADRSCRCRTVCLCPLTDLMRGMTVFESIAWFLVFGHAFITFFLQHIDDDDFSYIGTAATSYVTDTLMVYNGGTGMLLTDYTTDGMNRLMAAPQYAFYAFLSKMTGIGPAVLCHTILPPVFTLLFFSAFFMLAGVFFKNDRKSGGLFVMFCLICSAFSAFSEYSAGSFLMIRSWQGKAQITGLILPLVLWYWLRGAGDTASRREEFLNLLVLTMILAAASLQTAMGAVLASLASGCFMLIDCVRKRSARPVILSLPAYIIPVVCALVYLRFR